MTVHFYTGGLKYTVQFFFRKYGFTHYKGFGGALANTRSLDTEDSLS